ncbi:MAG: Integrase core domain protein, partial [Nocardioides sp.]|nr:Integrase core domain protein [Nocardioides sp.]
MVKPPLPYEVERRFWAEIRAGLVVARAAIAVGASPRWGWRVFYDAGGVNPVRVNEPVGRYLWLDEREEIMRLDAAGLGVRAIARELGRDPATVSRELKRGQGYRGYKASVAQARADRARGQPRGAKLATNLRLRREV